MNSLRSVPGLLLAAIVASGCITVPPGTAERINALPAADVILLGEQHDAPEHQRIHHDVVQALAAQGRLAAVAIEMAEQGTSTADLRRTGDEELVRSTLRWNEAAWPWRAYGPAIMAAVRAGVPVAGANLPRSAMRAAMADTGLDGKLPAPALKAQKEAIRLGHCGLLPETQIGAMTRIQVARDIAMAQTVDAALVPGKTVVLIAGSAHVDRALGVPQHLQAGVKAHAVRLVAAAPGAVPVPGGSFDDVWPTAPVEAKDYCAGLQQQMQRAAQPR